jgi:hypothetical protein
LLAAYGNYIATLFIRLFKVLKTGFINTWLGKASGILKQLMPNIRYIAQLIATALPLNTLYNIEQEINNIPLHETLQNGKYIRMPGDQEVNINKAYNNKYQYIKTRPNRVARNYIVQARDF